MTKDEFIKIITDYGYFPTDEFNDEFEYETAYWTHNRVWINDDKVSLILPTCSYSGNHDYSEPDVYNDLSFEEALEYLITD